MTTLIKELIDISDRVQKGDFVLRLAEDINRPKVVLGNYVVTPELATCFDAALSFIGSAVQNRTSKASYLHGSMPITELPDRWPDDYKQLVERRIEAWQPPKKVGRKKRK